MQILSVRIASTSLEELHRTFHRAHLLRHREGNPVVQAHAILRREPGRCFQNGCREFEKKSLGAHDPSSQFKSALDAVHAVLYPIDPR